MKIKILLFLLLFFQTSFGQTVFGKWKTIDDETGEAKGIVEIFEHKGKVFGKIIEIFEHNKKHLKCEKCQDDDRNKPILGLIIIKGLVKSANGYDSGKITDPKNGKSYHCKMTLDGKDKLIVRGYIGISLFGRSQTWIRLK
ncbi:DUF2147 domain-containing protein [Flavobacterium sp.]|uniref:DUF2147 domain-containing protein n=1 Tax=Flavobacterium sp. TaxID=239 RepID=UPI00248A324E|nr:DUF2147 domain-containing protein [Flavobacterium sp.]MDI1317954.1 DUF2147 domain-containing protein [Flavobacterium sp.]